MDNSVDCINGEKIPGFNINAIIEPRPTLNNEYIYLIHYYTLQTGVHILDNDQWHVNHFKI